MNKQAAYELGVQLALRDAGIVKEAKGGLFMIDRELLKRAAPSEFTGAV